jgi:hypothetical protein
MKGTLIKNPKKYNTSDSIHITLDDEAYKLINDKSEESGDSRSVLISRLIKGAYSED